VREEAARLLDWLGERAEPTAREALRGKPFLEVRRRIEPVLGQLEWLQNTRPGAQVASCRSAGGVGNPEAVIVLDALAEGAPELRLTQEAQGSIERPARRVSAGDGRNQL
jgi:hypothetical protein